MSVNDHAPQFFCSALSGIAAEGPNVVLSFVTPIPSDDHKSRKYVTNVRLAMSSDSLKQMVELLIEAAKNSNQTQVHPMPEREQ